MIRIVWKKVRFSFFVILVTLFIGAIGFKILYPEVSFYKHLYMSGITITTVGFSDILGTQKTSISVIYTLFLMFIGMGATMYSISNLTVAILEGSLKETVQKEKIIRSINRMNNHTIVCGAGETGIHVIRELILGKENFCVIDNDKSIVRNLLNEYPNINVIKGDSTVDSVLAIAKIHSAKGMIICLSNDKDTLYLTISAKLLNHQINIVAKAIELSMIKKLKKAGANKVISPNYIGGRRMAVELLRPKVVDFIDSMMRTSNKKFFLHEIEVPTNSKLQNSSLKDSFINNLGINIIAFKENNIYTYNPSSEKIIKAGTSLLMICNEQQQKEITSLIKA